MKKKRPIMKQKRPTGGIPNASASRCDAETTSCIKSRANPLKSASGTQCKKKKSVIQPRALNYKPTLESPHLGHDANNVKQNKKSVIQTLRLRVRAYIHLDTSMYTYVYTVYIHKYMHARIHTYTYIHMHTYICIHTNCSLRFRNMCCVRVHTHRSY